MDDPWESIQNERGEVGRKQGAEREKTGELRGAHVWRGNGSDGGRGEEEVKDGEEGKVDEEV